MILVDASVWIDHFRAANNLLRDLLDRQQALTHPLIIGELAVGSLRDRLNTLSELDALFSANIAKDAEVRALIEREHLYAIGIGYVDAHLLASALITPDCSLWTRDNRLSDAAERLGIGAYLHH